MVPLRDRTTCPWRAYFNMRLHGTGLLNNPDLVSGMHQECIRNASTVG